MKAVTLYRPMTGGYAIENALNDFDRYMESFFGESPLTPALRNYSTEPAVDIREAADAYVLEAELPGYDEKNIEVHVDGGVLTIETKQEDKTERNVSPKKDEKATEERYVIRERRSASFSRSFKLPENADMEAITANFKNGLLSLEIKKRAETKKRVIRIDGEKPSTL
ncbi:molecular chaperone Hsp20 [Spirochaetia bacterium]|nr:molecular chaperone Hsp20 [Spirochaetia bacterium]